MTKISDEKKKQNKINLKNFISFKKKIINFIQHLTGVVFYNNLNI
jgi:hypothetical protein